MKVIITEEVPYKKTNKQTNKQNKVINHIHHDGLKGVRVLDAPKFFTFTQFSGQITE